MRWDCGSCGILWSGWDRRKAYLVGRPSTTNCGDQAPTERGDQAQSSGEAERRPRGGLGDQGAGVKTGIWQSRVSDIEGCLVGRPSTTEQGGEGEVRKMDGLSGD